MGNGVSPNRTDDSLGTPNINTLIFSRRLPRCDRNIFFVDIKKLQHNCCLFYLHKLYVCDATFTKIYMTKVKEPPIRAPDRPIAVGQPLITWKRKCIVAVRYCRNGCVRAIIHHTQHAFNTENHIKTNTKLQTSAQITFVYFIIHNNTQDAILKDDGRRRW